MDVTYSFWAVKGHEENQTSLVSHFFGALAGLVCGLFLLKNRREEDWETKLKKICYQVSIFYVIFCVLWNLTADYLWKANFYKASHALFNCSTI